MLGQFAWELPSSYSPWIHDMTWSLFWLLALILHYWGFHSEWVALFDRKDNPHHNFLQSERSYRISLCQKCQHCPPLQHNDSWTPEFSCSSRVSHTQCLHVWSVCWISNWPSELENVCQQHFCFLMCRFTLPWLVESWSWRMTTIYRWIL